MTPETFADLTTSAALGQIPHAAASLQNDPDAAAKRAEAIEARSKTVPNAYNRFRRQQNLNARVGAAVARPYVPSQLIENPPHPKDISLELLMASQTHMGHHTSRWNPANAKYIYGVRQGIHIISLETTAAYLRRAARVVEEVAYRGGLILFAGTRKGQMDIVTGAAKLAGGCHLFTKWTPGNITNRDVINQGKEVRIVDEKDITLQGFERLQRTGRPLVPDLIVCLNPRENYTMLYECGLANVPTIGIIDTDANPDWVTYAIPANDDRSVFFPPFFSFFSLSLSQAEPHIQLPSLPHCFSLLTNNDRQTAIDPSPSLQASSDARAKPARSAVSRLRRTASRSGPPRWRRDDS